MSPSRTSVVTMLWYQFVTHPWWGVKILFSLINQILYPWYLFGNRGLTPPSSVTITYEHGLWPNTMATGAYFNTSELQVSEVFDSPHANSSKLWSGEFLNWWEGIKGPYSSSRPMTLNDFGPLGFGRIWSTSSQNLQSTNPPKCTIRRRVSSRSSTVLIHFDTSAFRSPRWSHNLSSRNNLYLEL